MGTEEEHIFDLVIEGTTLKDLFHHENTKTTIVIDKNTVYGTSVTSFDDLLHSPYVENVKIGKGPPENKNQLTIETHPFLLSNQSCVVKNFSRKPFGGKLKYVEFPNLFFYHKNEDLVVTTPKNKTELVSDDFIGNVSKNILYKAFSTGNIDVIRKFLEENPSFGESEDKGFRLMISLLETHTDEKFTAVYSKFGYHPLYLYPLYGISEITENASMINAQKGCSYLLANDIKIEKHENNQVVVKTEHESLLGKEFIPQVLKKKKSYVRVVGISSNKDKECSCGYIIDNVDNTSVILLNESSKVCEKGIYIAYFVSEKCTPKDTKTILDKLFGEAVDLVFDVSFEPIYDLLQFQY